MTAPDPHALLAEAEALAEMATPGDWTYLDGMVWDQLEDGRPGIPLYKADGGALRRWGRDTSPREIRANGRFIAASRTLVPKLCAALRQALAENERLRAALAQSDNPCVYCTLPADRWAECAHGFPGCARADDAMGCPELGARMALD